jgi:transcriptional regulator with XRE-family HTH domain
MTLKELRIKKGLSQKQVAEALGITQQAYSRYEIGIRKPPKKHWLQLSELFDIDLVNTEIDTIHSSVDELQSVLLKYVDSGTAALIMCKLLGHPIKQKED